MNQSNFLRVIAFVAAVLISSNGLAQETHDSTYKLVAYVGGGGAWYVASTGSPPALQGDVSKFGPAATLRVMWQPDHLLGVGLESGWTKLYSYQTTGSPQGSVYVSAVPLYVVFSMRLPYSIHLFGGYGYSHVNTNVDYAGTVNVGTWSMGWIASCSYEHPLNEKLGLAAEFKWINAVESHDATLSLQVQLVYSFLKY